jgi:predicted nucleic acid-binding protein
VNSSGACTVLLKGNQTFWPSFSRIAGGNESVKTYVLDASALISFLNRKKESEKVRNLLEKAREGQCRHLMSVVNWGEVYYVVWRGRGQAAADAKLLEIGRLPIRVVDVDPTAAKLAATLKVRFGLPYADCFAAALASFKGATLVTADHDFKVLKNDMNIVMI